MSKKRGFTLIELLAVIVILAIIVVIAVPEIMDIVDKSTKETFASSVKLIASSAEEKRMSNKLLGITNAITCEDVAKLSTEDYDSCYIKFDSNGKAQVTIIGKGKFEGISVCKGTKENTVVVNECIVPVNFKTDSWETIITAVKDDNTSNYNVGDTKTVDLGELGKHTVRIANKTACDGTLASETACGFVIEFADIITNHVMNSSETNSGGWRESELRTYVNDTIYNVLPEVLKDAIIPTKVVSSHGKNDTTGTLDDYNFESNDYLYLLSTREVYGKEGTSNIIRYDTADGDTITRQLDWYELNSVTTEINDARKTAIKQNGSTATGWWLRTASSNNTYGFYRVTFEGLYDYEYGNNKANNTDNGVSPAFRLG